MQDGKSILFSDLLHICARRRIGNSGTGDERMELGIASGWAATGLNQSVKQLTKQK